MAPIARRDPRELFDLASELPDLTGSVLVVALDGFVDAGGAVQVARRHLRDALDHTTVARFDVDELIDYRARRPVMQFARDHWESYDTPELVLLAVRDLNDVPFLMLTGPEPDVQWDRFVAALQSLVDELGVRLTVGLDGIPMSVPHTRPARVIQYGSRPELYQGYVPWLGTLAVPGSAAHLLELRLAEGGNDVLGLAVPVPPYLAQTEYPSAAHELLRELATRSGLSFPLAALESAAEQTREAIDAQVGQSEELQALVAALEQQYDAFVRERETLEPEGGLPSADELGAELERFLAEQSRRRDNPPS